MVVSVETKPLAGDEPLEEESLNEMDAVAHGVEAKLKLITGFSEMVIYYTRAVARQLAINEEQINKWAARRAMMESSRNRLIYASIASN